MSIVASTLREARQRAGLTQRDLAQRAGIPATVLSAYENDHRDPSASTFFRILRAAGFSATFRPLPDPEACGRRLAQVLDLADGLPYRARPLTPPSAPWVA